MRLRLILLSVAVLTAVNSSVWASAMTDAFSQGSTMGSASSSLIASGITSASAQANIPSYGSSTSTQSSYFAGGNGNTAVPGAAQISTCATAAPGSNPMDNQYCNAVNFLATNPTTRPQVIISPTDPLLTNSRAISNDPTVILQNNGISSGGTTTQCTPVTTTTPPQYTTQICTTSQGLTSTQCVMGLVVNIATNTNYQCNQTVNAYQTQTCNRTAVVTIPAAIPATPILSCGVGYTLSGTNCTAPATAANPNYSCSSATATLSGTQCYEPAYQPPGSAATATSSPSVVVTDNSTNIPYTVMAPSPCPPGTTGMLINTFTGPVTVTNLAYACWSSSAAYCPAGSTYIVIPADYGATYWNGFCTSPPPTYSCPSGYTLSGSTCYPPMITPPPTPANVTYTCTSGSVLSGTSCIPTTPATVTYTCGAGSTLSGTNCKFPPITTWQNGCSALEALAL